MSYLIRRVLAKPRLILDEMCRLYGKFASYLRRVLCKTRLIFPRINGPIVTFDFFCFNCYFPRLGIVSTSKSRLNLMQNKVKLEALETKILLHQGKEKNVLERFRQAPSIS